MTKDILVDLGVHLDVGARIDPIDMVFTRDGDLVLCYHMTPLQSQQLRKVLERAEIAFQALADSHGEKGR